MTSYCSVELQMISRLIDRAVVRKGIISVIFHAKVSNIRRLQLRKHDNLLLFFISYDSKWRILGFWTKEAFWRRDFGKFWWNIGWKDETIYWLIVNISSKLKDMLSLVSGVDIFQAKM